jgi:hypothetical protein
MLHNVQSVLHSRRFVLNDGRLHAVLYAQHYELMSRCSQHLSFTKRSGHVFKHVSELFEVTSVFSKSEDDDARY